MKTPYLWLLIILLIFPQTTWSVSDSISILVLGDSLTAGYGLRQQAAFPAQLEQRLKEKGYPVRVINAGISGDTSAGGAARLAWSLADQPDIVIVELGANDALRGLSPQQTRKNLAAILSKLREKNIHTILTGMKAPRNLGEEYYNNFDRLYPELAAEFQVSFYPFFLEGVAGRVDLNQPDGIHPTQAGVQVIVNKMLPLVEAGLQP